MPRREAKKRFHQATAKAFHSRDKRTTDNSKFYKSRQWTSIRLTQLMFDPLCRECSSLGLVVAGSVIDHITPIEDGGDKVNQSNLQTLCASCHNRKSGREAHKRNNLHD